MRTVLLQSGYGGPMSWPMHAEQLADAITHRGSRWRDAVAATPRHLFVPCWWDRSPDADDWRLHDGRTDWDAWMAAAYSDQTLITQIGPLHADHAKPEEQPAGRPTSSSTLPSLVLKMLEYGQIHDGADVLDVATGSGYSAALAANRLGPEHVTSIDVDPYLIRAAADRLGSLDLHPRVLAVDATQTIPGTYDRIVSMVSTHGIPAGLLAALRPGGRLVTVLAGTALILTANRCEGGGEWAAEGRIERDWAMFMPTRSGTDYPAGIGEHIADAARLDDGEVTSGRYPVVCVTDAWELMSLLEVTAPGIVHDYSEAVDGRRVAVMTHPDGSWVRAEADGHGVPVVHQGGPRRLWDIFDRLREEWLRRGYFQLFGARALIAHDGAILLARGDWKAVIRP